jgi:hypothetical protein
VFLATTPPAFAAPAVQAVHRDATEAPLAISVAGAEGPRDPLAPVADLINEGQAFFDTADFTAAIERWTRAYAALLDHPDIAAARDLLTYQIAQAHIEAHAIDGQPTHLRKAERLLTRYSAGRAAEETEARASAELLREDVRAQIAVAPPPVILPEPAAPPPPVPKDIRPSTRPLQIVGGVSLGIGGALLVGTVVAAAVGARLDRDEARAVARGASEAELDELLIRRVRADQAVIGTAVAGALLVTAGVALLVTGRVRRGPLTAGPLVGAGVAGLSFRARF